MIASSIVLGVIASALVQWLKNAFATSKVGTLAILAIVSIVLALVGIVIQHFNLLDMFLGILATANIIYAFLIQFLEKPADVTAA